MAEVKASLEAAVRDANTGMITTEFVAQYIDKILVPITECSTAKLDIKIFTGKNTEKWFRKLNARSKGRTGNTSKKMFPVRTMTFERPSRILKEHKTVHTYEFYLSV